MTDIDLASDVVVALLYHGVIKNNRETTGLITKLTGLTYEDMNEAKKRMAKRVYRPFDVHATHQPRQGVLGERRPGGGSGPPPPANRETVARPPGMRAPIRERKTRVTTLGVPELWCTGHDGHPAHWAPEEDFMRRADRPHLRHTHCDEGRRSYQRSRRVSLRALDELHSVGVALHLDDDSNLVGIVCKACGQPFQPGDDIEGDAVMRHTLCPPQETAQ